jgi:hypothetical protein
MSRRAALVTQADVARALRAVEQTRYPGIVEITRDGTIRSVPANQNPPKAADPELDDDAPLEF